MMGKSTVLEIGSKAVEASDADQTEAIIHSTRRCLTRFAKSTIHQSVEEEDTTVSVRAILGKKIGVASTNSIDAASLERVARRAKEIAEHQRGNPDFTSLPSPKSVEEVQVYYQKTADIGPQERAVLVKQVVEKAEKAGLEAAGALSTQVEELSVVNSLGVQTYHPSTWATLTAIISSDDSSGYAASCSPDFEEIRAGEVAEEAVAKCLRGRNPVEIEPGKYHVLLEEYALAEILDWLSYIGFGAVKYQEGQSFMSGKIGEKIVGKDISIYDDGCDPKGCPLPFDFEGMPRQKVNLIENGVARGVVYDTITAGREGKESTGHALYPQAASHGPLPMHLHIEPGDSSKEEMLSSIEKGIWVTRFHYINGFLDPKIALFTGMTRGGTFLIEKGKLTRPIKNLRFTESMLKAFSNVEKLSTTTKVVGCDIGEACVLPALWIRDFSFTGKTEF